MSIDLRMRLQQRLAIDDSYVAIGGLTRIGGGEPRTLAKIRSPLMLLAEGGPFTKWFDGVSAEGALEVDKLPIDPRELVYLICDAIQQRATHVERVVDDNVRFLARLAISVQERTRIEIPQISETQAIWCRHFATSVSRAYGELADREERFASTAVLFVMGVSNCDGPPGDVHAWNWLVDFEHGRVWAFDPQNETLGREYPNLSALLWTFAAMKMDGYAVPGLRSLVRRFESVHGGTTLFHLGRHPITRRSRQEIVSRLESCHFERVIPSWQKELADCDAWLSAVDVTDIVRFSDT